MRSSMFSSILLSFLCVLRSVLGDDGNVVQARVESLVSTGTSLFPSTENGDAKNFQAKWISFDDDSARSKTLFWDNNVNKDTMAVLVADTGAWVFRISGKYQTTTQSKIKGTDVNSVYRSHKFFAKLAYPLFGYEDKTRTAGRKNTNQPSQLPNSLAQVDVDKSKYRKAWITSLPEKSGIKRRLLITALAWEMAQHTGLDVQWLGLKAPYLVGKKKTPRPFVLHFQPSGQNGMFRDLEIFDSGLRLLTATITSSTLEISQYASFDRDSFPAIGDSEPEESWKIKGDKPDSPDIAEKLWEQGPSLVKEFGYESHRPKALLIWWLFLNPTTPTVIRHLNAAPQENSILILVVTTKGSWVLAVPQLYCQGMSRVKNTVIQNLREHSSFKDFKAAILTGPNNIESWEYAAAQFSRVRALLIDIVVLSGFSDHAKQNDLTWDILIKATLLEMKDVSEAAASLLHGLESREMPFFTFYMRRQATAMKRDRFIMRHYTSESLIDREGKDHGSGEFFEYYYGGRTIIKGAVAYDIAEIDDNCGNEFWKWSDRATNVFTVTDSRGH